MDRHDIEQSVAELLGGEISAESRRQLEQALSEDPALRDELAGLQQVQELVRAVPTAEIPQTGATNETAAQIRRPRRIFRVALGTLKYAAILMIGIGLGTMLNAQPTKTTELPRLAVPEPPADGPPGIAPEWVQSAVDVTRDTGNGSSLLRQLRMLAAVKRGST